MKRILMVEDDPKLSQSMSKLIQAEGMAVHPVLTVEDLDATLAANDKFDAVLLDRLIGRHDTRERIGDIKRRWPGTPILVLSAINTPNERADLINSGVDDYMGKPFSIQELLARLKALSRRFVASADTYCSIGNSVLDLSRRTLTVDGKSESLPAKEFLILQALSREVGRVLNRNELLDRVWGMSYASETNVVEATITNLRRRLATIGSDISIRNMRNSGYWIES